MNKGNFIPQRIKYDEIIQHLSIVKENSDGTLTCICPFCETDGNSSGHLAIKRDGDDFISHCLKCDSSNIELIQEFFPISNNNNDKELIRLRALEKKRKTDQLAEKQKKINKDAIFIEDAVYYYRNENGECIFTKKKFKLKNKETGEWITNEDGSLKKQFGVYDNAGNKGIPRDPNGKSLINIYRLDNLKKAVDLCDDDKPIFIVEGEKDCDTLTNLGHTTITTYYGAGGKKNVSLTDVERELLSQVKKHLVIIPDNDEAGEKYIEVWKEFNPLVFKLINIWPDAPRKADITDYLNAGGSMDKVLKEVNNLKEERLNNPFPIEFEIDKVNYEINKQGVFRTKGKSRENICRIPVFIDRCYYDEDKNELFYNVKFTFRNKIEEILINSKIIQNKGKLASHDGRLQITTSNSGDMVKFLNDYIAHFEIDSKENYPITDKLFVDDKGLFVGFGSKIKLNNEKLLKAFKPKGSRDKWLSAASDIWLNGSLIEVFEFCKLGISLCVNLMNDLTPIFELTGKTGIGKTVLMQNRISMYGNPAKGAGIFSTGNTTVKAVDKLLEQSGFLPAEMDEGELLRNSKELKDDEGVKNFIYGTSEGLTRDRLQQDSNKNDFERNDKRAWNTILNLTIEGTLLRNTLGAGTINRVITIKAKPEDFKLSNKHFKTLQRNYGWFIRELEEKRLFAVEEIEQFIDNEEQFTEIEGYDEIASKQKSIVKYLAYTIEKFNEVLGERDYYIDDFFNFFRKEEELDMIHTYIEDIYNLINQNHQKFFDRTDPELQLNTLSKGDVWGVITDDYIYVNKNKLDDFFKTKYRISFKSIAEELEEKGVLIMQKNGKSGPLIARYYGYKGLSFNAIKLIKNPKCETETIK